MSRNKSHSNFFGIFVFAFACFFVAACPSESRWARQHKFVAKVGDTKITSSAFTIELWRAGFSQLSSTEDRVRLGHAVLDGLIQDELLLIGARLMKLTLTEAELEHALRKNTAPYARGHFRQILHLKHETPEVYREQLKRHLLVEKFWVRKFAQLPRISNKMIDARIKLVGVQQKPRSIRARHILLQTSDEAHFVVNQLTQKRVPFEAAAKRYSQAPEAEQGGDLGWFSEGELPKVFDVCFALQKNRISEIIPSEYGFHIFQLVDEKPAQTESIADAKTRIKVLLEHEQELRAMNQIMNELKSDIHVVVYERALTNTIEILSRKKKQGGRST